MQAATVFDPAVHLAFRKPESRVTMAELGLADVGISPIAVTAPFPLFSLEGVTELRRNILSDEVIDKFTVSSYLSAFQGREFTKNVAPFVHGKLDSLTTAAMLLIPLHKKRPGPLLKSYALSARPLASSLFQCELKR